MNKLIMKPDCMPAILLASIFMAMGMASPAHGQAVEPALEASRQAAEGTRESQENIDEIDARTQELLGEYRANLRQLEQLNPFAVDAQLL